MTKSIVLITGANQGIGYEAVKAFLESEKSYVVLLGSRSLEKAGAAIEKLLQEVPQSSSVVESIEIDVTNDGSIDKAAELVGSKYGRLDALVNNAGGKYEYEYDEGKLTMRELWNKTWDVNVTGAQVMTHVFMPLLMKSADPRVLFLTSGLSSIQNTSAKYYPQQSSPPAGTYPKDISWDTTCYRSSKAGLNMLMVNWAWRMSEDGVKFWGVAPGFLATNLGNDPEMFRKRNAGHPSVGGNFIRGVVEGSRDDAVGKVVHSDGHVQLF